MSHDISSEYPVWIQVAARLALAVVLLAAVFLALPARAQGTAAIATLKIDLWPEFDRPSMLVMYQISMSPDFKAPGEVRLRIPAAVGSPNAVAVCEPSGNCFNTPFTQEQGGQWITLVISATMPDLRVEYYDPQLEKDGAKRHFEFEWAGDYAVNSFQVHVQQPAGAREMRLKPGTVSQSVENDGLTYYTLDAGSISAGQPVTVVIDYAKDSDALSNTSLPVAPIEPLAAPTGKLNVSSSAPMILGGVGVALILGGGLWYWYSGRKRSLPVEPRRRRRKSAAQAPAEADGALIYCHQCGNRAAPGDRFCRTCGTTLRKA